MPRPIPVPIRQAMFRLWQKGYGTRQIAESLGLPCSTLRRLLQRFRLHGTDGLSPDYWHPSVPEVCALRVGGDRHEPAPRAPHLGGWPDPGATPPGGAGTTRSLGANAPTLVRTSRPVSGPGGTTTKDPPRPGDRAPRNLADGCKRTYPNKNS